MHGLFLPFPIALLTGSLVADLSYWTTRDAICVDAASWLAGVALAALVLSLIAGLLEVCWTYVFGSGAAALLLVVDVLMRNGTSADAILPAGPFLTALAAAILLFSGLTGVRGTAIPRSAWRDAFVHGARSLGLYHAGR